MNPPSIPHDTASMESGSVRRQRRGSLRDLPMNQIGASSVAPAPNEIFLEKIRTPPHKNSEQLEESSSPSKVYTSPNARNFYEILARNAFTIFTFNDMAKVLYNEHADVFEKLELCNLPWTIVPIARQLWVYHGEDTEAGVKLRSAIREDVVDMLIKWTNFNGPYWIFIYRSYIGDFFDLDRLLGREPLDELIETCRMNNSNVHARVFLDKIADNVHVSPNPQCLEIMSENELKDRKFDYGLVVIGGGNSGIAAARAAARKDFKVCLFDFVKPTFHGYTWQVGGTCLMVGCIPKKILHYAAQSPVISGAFSKNCWKIKSLPDGPTFNWGATISNIRDYLGSGSFSYKKFMRNAGITFFNAHAKFSTKADDDYVVVAESGKGKKKKTIQATAPHVLIAGGLRPKIPDVPGATKYGITTDDFFFREVEPGNTLIIGASYSAVECAGVIRNNGYPVTLLVRSHILRGYDHGSVAHVQLELDNLGIASLVAYSLVKIEDTGKQGPNKIQVLNVTLKTPEGDEEVREFNSVLFAAGREARTTDMNFEKNNIERDGDTGRIPASFNRSNKAWAYVVGDIKHNGVQRAPVASAEGSMVGSRLSGLYHEPKSLSFVSSVCFTSTPYGYFGMSEDLVRQSLPANTMINVYERRFYLPTTFILKTNGEDVIPDFCKFITAVQLEDGALTERIYGMHVVCADCEIVVNGLSPLLLTFPTVEYFRALNPCDGKSKTSYIVETLSHRYKTVLITRKRTLLGNTEFANWNKLDSMRGSKTQHRRLSLLSN